jgi:hypothetical protein
MREPNGAYDVDALRALFGASKAKVQHWIQEGLFGKRIEQAGAVRIPEAAVVRFVRNHAAEYRLSKVDQPRFRALLFGGIPRRSRKRGGLL